MKIVLSMNDPRLRASPRHGGQGSVFYSPIRRGGSPSGAAAFIASDGERDNNPHIIAE